VRSRFAGRNHQRQHPGLQRSQQPGPNHGRRRRLGPGGVALGVGGGGWIERGAGIALVAPSTEGGTVSRKRTLTLRAVAFVAALLLVGLGSACSSKSSSSSTKGKQQRELVGLFRLTPGRAEGGRITGSWFRMLQPGGTPKAGPF